MRRPGIEPGTTAWKAAMLTITPSTLLEVYSYLKPEIIFLNQKYRYKRSLHRPGIEPGPPAWQASILPLNQRCLHVMVRFEAMLDPNSH